MVHLTDVTKYYGEKRALGPISFEVPKGDTVGCLGLNGVGKTTLLRILACGLRPSSGRVEIDGLDVLEQPHEVRKRVGYLPELPPVYGEMPVGEYLTFAGRLKGLPADGLDKRVREVEEYTHLTEVHHVPTRHLSQGYRQRVGVAQAIIHDPEILILDEPTHDLDPVQIVEMREMIKELKGSRTMFISSHILPEISQTCDRLLILNAGRIVASGSEDELRDRLLQTRHMTVTLSGVEGDPEPARTLIAGIAGVRTVRAGPGEGRETIFEVEADDDVRGLLSRTLVEGGYDVVALGRRERELESLFVGLVGGGEAH